jgi:hypothetical protein
MDGASGTTKRATYNKGGDGESKGMDRSQYSWCRASGCDCCPDENGRRGSRSSATRSSEEGLG